MKAPESSWTNFEEEAARLAKVPGTPCTVETFLAGLPPDGKRAVLAAIENNNITAPSILRALEARGLKGLPTLYTLKRHRRMECQCHRSP